MFLIGHVLDLASTKIDVQISFFFQFDTLSLREAKYYQKSWQCDSTEHTKYL